MLFAHVAGDAAEAVHLAGLAVREQQADGAQRAVEEASQARAQLVESLIGAGGDELSLGIQGPQARKLALVQAVDLVEHDDPGGLAADHVEHVGHRLLAHPDLGRVEAGVGDHEHDVGQRRLLERGWKASTSWCGSLRMNPTVSVTT